MALDPNIILQARGVQLDSPLDTYARVAQVQAARNQNRIADLAFQDRARATAADASLAGLISSGSTGADVVKGLAGQGFGSQALAYQKTNQEALKSAADIKKTEADTIAKQQEQAQHQFEIAGQLAGSWATNPGISKPLIQAGINAAANAGVLTPQVAQAQLAELDKVADDPRSLNGWAATKQQQVISAKDQMANMLAQQKNAETIRSNKAGEALTASGQAVTMRGQNMVDSRAKDANAAKEAAANNPDGMIPPDVLTTMAQQALAGDTSVYQNLGRGAQGAKNIIALRSEVARLNKEGGGNGRDIAAQNAEYFGTKAGQRSAGTRIANVEMAVQEARNLVPLALDASAKVARSGLLPFGKAQIMFDTQTNDPLLGQFAAANNALINTYARAISPSGVPTVADKEHAREMLSTAKDHRAYVAIVKQMDKEMSAAQEAPQHVRQAFNQAVTGKKPLQTVPNPVAPTAAIPKGAADMLKSNPALRNDFDKKYGAGAAASVLGK